MTTQQIETKTLAPYKKKTSLIVSQANELAIKTEKSMEIAVDYLKRIKEMAQQIKTEKEKLTKPAMEVLKNARTLFAPFEKNIKEAEFIVKDKMLKFDELQQAKAAEKIEKIEAKVKAGKIDLVKGAEKMEKVEPKKSYEGNVGKVQYRTVQKIVITNWNKIPREYLLLNESLIRRDLLKGVSVPGAKLVSEKSVAAY